MFILYDWQPPAKTDMQLMLNVQAACDLYMWPIPPTRGTVAASPSATCPFILLTLSGLISDRYKERELKSNLLLNMLPLLSIDGSIVSAERATRGDGTIIKKYDNASLLSLPCSRNHV